MDRVELRRECTSPVVQNVAHRYVVRDGERQVEIRPAIAATVCESADDGGGDHTRIGIGHLQHAVAHPVTVVDAEHERMLAEGGRCFAVSASDEKLRR